MAYQITLHFQDGFNGKLEAEHAQAAVGKSEDQLRPYDMLLAALGSCYYSTFLDIMQKKRIHYDRCEIHVDGERRDAIPPTLETCHLKVTIFGAASEKGFEQAATLAAKYCSIYQTISHVAEMSWSLNFEP